MNRFQELLPQTCEFNNKQGEDFNKQMNKLNDKKRGPDAYGFIDYLTSNEMKEAIGSLNHKKITKKKPLNFDRLNMIMMAIFKYMEAEKKGEIAKVKVALDKWCNFVVQLQSPNINSNAVFETLLNLYLVLGTDTSLKA